MENDRSASTESSSPDDDTRPLQPDRDAPVTPVSDGPGQHHANADTRHSPAPPHKVQRF